MAWQIIKQPDGLFGVFSSNVDDWVATDCTPDEVEELFAEEAGRDMMRRLADVRRKIALVAEGEARKVYYQFAMTHEEAEQRRAEVHDREDDETDPDFGPDAWKNHMEGCVCPDCTAAREEETADA